LTGVPGAANLEERIRGFKDEIKKYPDIQIVKTVACNDDINLGVQVVEETMQAVPDLKGWFFVGLWPLFAKQGSMKQWEAAAKAGTVKTISFDTLPVELDFVKGGYIQGLVGQKYWGWGYDTVQMIYDKIVSGKKFDDWTDSGMDIVAADNVDAMKTMWDTHDFTKPLPPAFKHKALADNKVTIAWIPKALNNPVFETGRAGALKKAEELTAKGPYKVEIQYVGSVASDIAEQSRVVEDVIAKGVDAIGISCNEPAGCEAPIKKALAAGIEVMTWDSDSPKSGRFTYLGVSNYDGGKAAADLLVRAMGTKGKVALLTGVPGAANLEERIRGFKDEIKKYPDIQIVKTVACNDDINLGVQVVEETMQAVPDLKGWFFVGLWPLFAKQGSMKTWEAAAKAGTVKTISFDTLPVELDFMKAGYVQGLVGQKYWGWGYDTVQMIYDKIVSGKKFGDWTDSGMDLVTPKNVDAMKAMWDSNDFTKPLPSPF
jgi:ribose transport system substrate-binding protein